MDLFFWLDAWFNYKTFVKNKKKAKSWFLRKCCHFSTTLKNLSPLFYYLEKTLESFLKTILSMNAKFCLGMLVAYSYSGKLKNTLGMIIE
jgi:hypothetical protein